MWPDENIHQIQQCQESHQSAVPRRENTPQHAGNIRFSMDGTMSQKWHTRDLQIVTLLGRVPMQLSTLDLCVSMPMLICELQKIPSVLHQIFTAPILGFTKTERCSENEAFVRDFHQKLKALRSSHPHLINSLTSQLTLISSQPHLSSL